ncbi:ATP-binding protein [Microbulbifer thermotolerans]|uniref:ATP-binding protein n=1 Tax=Microbulbifer thermotolerans TaxID=252514 RepID=UPI00224979BE|nr:ATP-binding protein [Microbulbifer thermotolerans]MCX2795337.1 ATP-binding protein [Microbulbifer thermotolerans]
MSLSPMAYADSLRIGTVDFVSPDEIKVLLDIEAPDGVALNTGTPRPFPRINGYVLIPGDQGYLVAQVEWITIERSQYPKRKGMQDFGLVDLPYPLRKMSLNPLGVLTHEGTDQEGESQYRFRRGVESYPCVSDAVLLPTPAQLKDIVESGDNRRVQIGTSPLAGNARVCIDPDRLFGRHLAVLGNTGSGKSCSVAGLIRWSLEAAKEARGGKEPNARFVVLDPNGEYAKTFDGLGNVRVYAVEPGEGMEQLQVPLWFWNSAEWSAFTQASERAQRPLLRRALREMRGGSNDDEDGVFLLRRKLSSILINLKAQVRNGEMYEGWKFGPKLLVFFEDLEAFSQEFHEHKQDLEFLANEVRALLDRPGQTYTKQNGQTGYNNFPATAVESVISSFQQFLSSIGGVVYQEGPNEDVPLKFDGAQFADHLEELANQETNSQFFDFLIMRIRTMLSESRIKRMVSEGADISLAEWLEKHIGDDQSSNGSITVIDLSLVPAEVIHIITAVIARMTLEALQRYRKLNHGQTLPTVLVMEEAHTFIKGYKDDAENQNSAAICCQVFEKIAREGRKFGLGLVLSSQRPSELSPTVLSQCNSYLLHRISNDRDQELVHKLVPDNLRGLLRDLPSLPARQAILLGWASELPVLVQMNQLPEAHRPKSDDPDFWAVWSGQDNGGKKVDRPVDWKAIADDWQQLGGNIQAEQDSKSVQPEQNTDNTELDDDIPF